MKGRAWTNEQWEYYKGRVLATLAQHIGEEKAIPADELYERVFSAPADDKINATKPLRKVVRALRKEGTPIGSSVSNQGGGYYLARTASELDQVADRFLNVGLKAFIVVSRMRKIALPELLGQMRLNLEKNPNA